LTRVRHVVRLRKNIKVLNNNSNILLNNELRVVCGGGSVSCTGEFSPNFDPKNMISTYSKDFLWKKWPKFTRFWDFFFYKSPDFCDNFQQVAKYIEGFSFFSTFISIMQPNLAKLFCEWLPLWLHHKILKRNPGWGWYWDVALTFETCVKHMFLNFKLQLSF
jgi:hypothetical protein